MDDLEKAHQGKGTWVKREDMHPAANVWRRVYRTRSGRMGTFYGTLSPPEQVEAWFYPDDSASQLPSEGEGRKG